MKSAQKLLIVTLVTLLLVSCSGEQPQPETYKVGVLQLVDLLVEVEDGFKAEMAGLGYVEGENVVYVRQSAQGNMEDLARFAQEMVDEKVDIIVTITTPSSLVAMQASEGTDIPIVFILVSDPVRAGLVESITHPGGRVTGIKDAGTDMTGKRLELLQRMAPDIQTVLSIYSYEETMLPAAEALREAADALGLELVERQVHTTEEAIAAFQAVQPGEVDAIYIPSDAIVANANEAIVALALRDGLPYVFPGKQPNALAAYGENFTQAGAQAAVIVDKIMHGTLPASIPVEITKKFDLIIDLTVAEQIGVDIPEEILDIANVVIE